MEIKRYLFTGLSLLFLALDGLGQEISIDTLGQWLSLSTEYRYNNPDSSRFYARKVLDAARASNNQIYEGEALRNISTAYESQGDFSQALLYGNESLTVSRQHGDAIRIAHVLNGLGMIYDQLGNFPEALRHYTEARTIYRENDDEEHLAMMDLNLGILFKAQGEYKRVVQYYRDAYAIYKKLKMPAEIAFCEANLGSVFYFTQDYDSCVYYSLRAEKALGELNILQFQPVAQTNAGMGYFELGQLDKADVYLQKALRTHRQYGNKREISFVLIQRAKVHKARGQLGRSYVALDEAKALAEEISSPQQVVDASKLLAEYYESIADFQRAYREHVYYTIVKDTLFEKDKAKAISNFQIQFDTEKKEQQIELLHQETAIKGLQIRQRNILLLSTLGFLVSGAAIAFFVFRHRRLKAESRLQQERYYQKQQTTRAVLDAEERERRRIAGDLHDGVGQILSAALLNLSYLKKGISAGQETDVSVLDNALHLVKDSYEEMRSISHQIMPNALLKAGLASSIKEFLDKIDGRQIEVRLDVIGLDERLDEQIETVLYRAVQEAVNNVVKHAGATVLVIQLVKDEEGISVTIEDNGKGFDLRDASRSEGIGLKNMRSRLALLGGSVDIDATVGRGTVLTITVPTKEAP